MSDTNLKLDLETVRLFNDTDFRSSYYEETITNPEIVKTKLNLMWVYSPMSLAVQTCDPSSFFYFSFLSCCFKQHD